MFGSGLKVFFFFLYPLGRVYAVQKGIKIDSKGKDSRAFLLDLMDKLEMVSLLSVDHNRGCCENSDHGNQ